MPGQGPDPKPLLLLHGWPGSVFEFLDIIPRLTDPARFGGDARDAFTVVAPSLPGYGMSFRPGQKRFDTVEMGDCFAALMTEVLGYRRFGVQGGDWGASIASGMGVFHADKVRGIHLNLLIVRPDLPPPAHPTAEEARYQEEVGVWLREETGYQWIQGTRPQTLAFGLTDSPAGLAAWIVEKFRAWSDCGGDVERAIDRDHMLANIALYWFTGAIGSSFWPYYARMHGPWPVPDGRTVDVPMGYAAFPREIRRPPRSIAARMYTDIRRWTVMEQGRAFRGAGAARGAGARGRGVLPPAAGGLGLSSRSREPAAQPNRPPFGNPFGGTRPAWPRSPSQGRRSVSVRVLSPSRQVRPSAQAEHASHRTSPPSL